MRKFINTLKEIDFRNIKPSTYVSAVILVLTVINYVLNLFGKPAINVDETLIGTWVIAIVGVIGVFYGWWKNQNCSEKAIVAGDILDILKDGRITVEELEDFIARYSETDLDTEADYDEEGD